MKGVNFMRDDRGRAGQPFILSPRMPEFDMMKEIEPVMFDDMAGIGNTSCAGEEAGCIINERGFKTVFLRRAELGI
jgi:hypothetical protein